MPTTWEGTGKVHESVMRAYHILDVVKYLLKYKTPNKLILRLIAEMEGKEWIDWKRMQ